MFYLLENNRIIDSEISYTTNFPYWEVKDNRLYAKSKNDKIVRPYNENKIKTQSENVYDLIEKGDLITEKRIWCGEEVYVIANVCSKEDKLIHCFHSTLFEDNVYAIYKPDANGNYIKVWEAKDEKN